MSNLRIGIIGCGRVVQTVHLAALAGIPGLEVAAVCDADAEVVSRVGERLGVAARFTAAADLAACPEVDAVLVATRVHVGPVLDVLAAGKHLLVEKPLCYDPATAASLARAAREADVVAMIGYMKRYDWCFERFSRLAGEIPDPWFSRVHDFACRFDKSDSLFVTVPSTAAPPAADSPRTLAERLLTFASHDFAVIRGAVGEVEEVTFVQSTGPATLVAGLICRGGRVCTLELSLDTAYEWFDETLTVYGGRTMIGMRFADPFVPFARSSLWVRRAGEDGEATETSAGPFEDAFRREWRHFAACIRDGAAPRTPLAEGVADAELAAEIVARIPAPASPAAEAVARG